MEIDVVLACLLVLLGALCAYIFDEMTGLTPRLAIWLDRVTRIE
jgi:hypothetical protein